nr:unnamed protein product [Callosobruchus analis]
MGYAQAALRCLKLYLSLKKV